MIKAYMPIRILDPYSIHFTSHAMFILNPCIPELVITIPSSLSLRPEK